MSRFITYIRLRIKAVMKVYPAMCVMTLLLCLSLGSMLYMQSLRAADMTQKDEDEKAAVGIVGLAASGYLDTAFSILKNFDSSSDEVNFVSCKSRKDAAARIRSGELLGAIVIPAGLVDTLLAGETGRMTLILPSSGAGLNTLLIKELSDSISVILSSLHSGSDALRDYMLDNGYTDADQIAEQQTDLLLTSLQDVLHRSRLFKVRYVSATSQVSIESFYLISMLVLLILLLGIMCAASYVRSDYTLGRLLRMHHLGSARQVIAEYISLTVLLAAVVILFYPLIAVVLSRMPIPFSAFGVTGNRFIRGFLRFSPHYLCVLFLASAIDLFLYEISSNLITGVLIQFLTMIALAYGSGIFYSVQTMPGPLQKIAGHLPTGHALTYLQMSAKHAPEALFELFCTILWTIAFLILTILVRRHRLTAKGGV